jgi:hypothetical protein
VIVKRVKARPRQQLNAGQLGVVVRDTFGGWSRASGAVVVTVGRLECPVGFTDHYSMFPTPVSDGTVVEVEGDRFGVRRELRAWKGGIRLSLSVDDAAILFVRPAWDWGYPVLRCGGRPWVVTLLTGPGLTFPRLNWLRSSEFPGLTLRPSRGLAELE